MFKSPVFSSFTYHSELLFIKLSRTKCFTEQLIAILTDIIKGVIFELPNWLISSLYYKHIMIINDDCN